MLVTKILFWLSVLMLTSLDREFEIIWKIFQCWGMALCISKHRVLDLLCSYLLSCSLQFKVTFMTLCFLSLNPPPLLPTPPGVLLLRDIVRRNPVTLCSSSRTSGEHCWGCGSLPLSSTRQWSGSSTVTEWKRQLYTKGTKMEVEMNSHVLTLCMCGGC